MKKHFVYLLIAAILFAGCSNQSANEDIPIDTNTDITDQTQPQGDVVISQQDMAAVALPVVEEHLTDENGIVLFTYTGQSMNLVLPDPDVADKILIDFFTRQDGFRQASEGTKASAANNNTGYAMFYSALYEPARIDLNVLSLSGTIVHWAGGAHPSYSCIFANYDMVTGDILTLGSILSHENKASELGELVIQAIADAPSELGIWDGYEDTIRTRFTGNISEDQSWFFSREGLSFSFPPYDLAPYASGVITVTVPYDKLVGIIDDAFFPVEQPNTVGELSVTPMEDAQTQDFSQIAEVLAHEDGHMVLLHTDQAVTDVRIEMDHTHIIFATAALTPGDAIMLQADLADHILVIHYISDGQQQSRYIQVAESTVRLTTEIPS